ncbi:MAG: DUF3526 domain-containing protein [Deltaproteobacteria bacterium]|nr:DUF3526 domain-containing protein [Nannocystaceae bacterium]
MNTVMRHELTRLYRERSVRWVASAMTAVVMVAALAALVSRQRDARARAEASEYAQRRWLDQGAKNPHGAAHFGTFVFAPVRVLSALADGDAGAFGTVVRVEAHVRTPLGGRALTSIPTIGRFGWPTPVGMCELLLPLLAIALGHGAFSGDAERGLESTLRATGVGPVRLAVGKLLGAELALLSSIAPALVAVALLTVLVEPTGATLVGATAIIVGIGVYGWMWTAIAVAISAACRRESVSFVVGLGLWAITCVVLPQLAAEHAAARHHLRGDASFDQDVRADLGAGPDDGDSADARIEALRDAVLAEHGVERVEDLPLNFDGLALQEGEEHSAEVYAEHFDRAWDALLSQQQVVDAAAIAAPSIALRRWSSAIAQTDLVAQRTVAESVEDFRRAWVAALNADLTTGSRTGDHEYRADAALWSSVPQFEPPPSPGFSALARRGMPGGVVLLGWSLVATLAVVGLGATRERR